MAQRGGAVQAHLRLADRGISSDLIARAGAQMILSVEPLEAWRYLEYLDPEGVVISSANPFRNISDYPDIKGLIDKIEDLPASLVVDAAALAREAGSIRATNMVMVGAAAGELPVRPESLIQAIRELFAAKGQGVVEANLKAFASGREIAAR